MDTDRDGWAAAADRTLLPAPLSSRTKRMYRFAILDFGRWLEREGRVRRLEHVRADDINRYVDHLTEVQGCAPTTVNVRLHALRYLFRSAVRAGLVPSDPAADVERATHPRRPAPDALGPGEVRALLAAAGSSRRSLAARNYAIVQLFLQAGLRVSELATMTVREVALHERSGHLTVRGGGGRPARMVPLNAAARRALRLYFRTRGGAPPADEPLFLNQSNGPMSPRSIQELVQKLARRAKLIDVRVTPYALRHTFSVRFLEDHPGEVDRLSELLGVDAPTAAATYLER